MRLDRFRALIGAVVAIALASGLLVGCGDDDDEAQNLTLTLGKNGVFQTPKSAETGLAEITFRNDSSAEADAQLIRVEGDRSTEQVIQGLNAVISGKEIPSWFFAAGGTPAAAPGKSKTVTQALQPGSYFVVDTNADQPPDPATFRPIAVTGEEPDAELPGTDATVTAIDYGYEIDGELTAGSSEITFENTGAQPHHIIASLLKQGATIEDAEKFFKSNAGGQGPFVPGGSNSDSTSVLEGGTSQTVTLQVKEPGNYALYCFITDRQGGPPHALKGMVDEVEVR